MARAPDPYPFLSMVEDYLAGNPDDHALRAAAIGALARKGLFTVAVELGRACPGNSPDGLELQSATGQLAQAGSEIVDWSATDERFKANLAALKSRGETGRALAEEMEAVWEGDRVDLTLHQANDGNLLVRGTRSDGRRIWIPAALDYAGTIETIVDAESLRGRLPTPLLLDGVGMGWLVPRLHAATERTYLNYSPAIFVVETNLRALALVLRLHDWTAVLSDERVYLFGGSSAWSDWRALMDADVTLPLPEEVHPTARWPGQQPSPAEQTRSEVAAHRDSLHAELRHRAETIYADRDATYWADRFESAGPADPLRVLFITSRYSTFLQHSTRDLAAAMERAGLRTRILIEGKDHASMARQTCMAAFAEFRPDLVVLIDHHRHERPDWFVADVPVVCWIQDALPWLFNAEAGRKLGPLDFTIGFGLTECVLRHNYPAQRFMPCRLAIDRAKFAPAADNAESDPALGCDVAYVSHHSASPEVLHAELREKAGGERTCRVMDVFFEETRPLFASERFNAGYDLESLLREAEARAGVSIDVPGTRSNVMNVYVRPLADRSLRHTTLKWAADWADGAGRTLHLYGRGWEEHPRFSRYARGPAEHGHHLGEIARQAAINLHTGMNGALHQRVLETACAGGFVMARHHPHDFFEPGHASFEAFLRERGIDRPARIPFEEFPPDYVEMRRRLAGITGREVPTEVEISEEMLLKMRTSTQQTRRYHRANLAFPDLDRLVFDSAESFARRAEWFLEHRDERDAISRRMQEAVNEMFTYDALVPRILGFVAERLGHTAVR